MLQFLVNTRHNILPIDQNWLIRNISQRGMKHGTILREVDFLALEHLISESLNIGILGNLNQELESLFGQEVLAEIEQDLAFVGSVGECVAELLEAGGVLLEFVFEDEGPAYAVVVLL